MRSLAIVAVCCGILLCSGAAQGDQKEFAAWWQKETASVAAPESGKPYVRNASIRFNSMEDFNGRAIKIPAAISKKVENIRLLYAQKEATLLLATPENILKKFKTINDQYYEQMQKCADDRSWIIVKANNAWSEIALNPYCTTAYGEDEIAFDLYWLSGAAMPYIDVVTNGATCVPHQLYEWDQKASQYKRVAEKCVQ